MPLLHAHPVLSARSPRAVRAALPALLALATTAAHALDTAQVTARLTPSVYALRTVGPQEAPLRGGSAVVIGPGRLVTACHLLAGARGITVRRENLIYGATLEAPDVERDLCLIRVANFTAPAVSLATGGAPAFGQKVFAAGAVDVAGVSVREGTVAGLRAGADGKLDRIQAAVDTDAGASGGGLFDDAGKLLGVLTARAAGDKLLPVLPAAWITEAPARAAGAVANYKPSSISPAATAAATPAAAVAATTPATVAPARDGGATSPRVGETWRYTLTDRMTKLRRDVLYRIDKVDGDTVTFNQGARIENRDGGVQVVTPIGGDFDGMSPPKGWVPADVKPGMRWKYSYRAPANGNQVDIAGTVGTDVDVVLPAGTFHAIRIQYSGYVQVPIKTQPGSPVQSVRMLATAWYDPALGRVVRFDSARAGEDSMLQLAEHRTE